MLIEHIFALVHAHPGNGNQILGLSWHPQGMDINWPSTQPISGAAQASLKRLQSAIAIATGLTLSGRDVDLAGIESVAGLLCAQVLDLPSEDGRAMRPALMVVAENVATLIAGLNKTS